MEELKENYAKQVQRLYHVPCCFLYSHLYSHFYAVLSEPCVSRISFPAKTAALAKPLHLPQPKETLAFTFSMFYFCSTQD